jgi:hypothetical protein
VSFSITDVIAAAGVGNPWEIGQQVLSGDPAAVLAMGDRFATAAGHAQTAMTAATRADTFTAASYVVDGAAVHDGPAATAATRTALADGGERLTEVASSVRKVSGELSRAQGTVKGALAALDGEIAAVVAESNRLAGQVFPTQAAADAASKALFDRAVTAVRGRGGTVTEAVADYDEVLRGGTNVLATYGYAAQGPGEDMGPRYESLDPEGGLSAAAIATMALDLAGIFDPTPVSDGLSGLLSLFRGEWAQAGLSVAAMVPWIGDTGKVLKFGKQIGEFKHLAGMAGDVGKLQNILKSLKHADPSSFNSALGTMNRMAGDAAKRYENPHVLAAAQQRGLPTEGPVPFVPPKNWNHSNPAQDTLYGRRGVVDAYQNVWHWDPVKSEWDVQISAKGKKLGSFSPDGKHANIGTDGVVTH